MSVKAGIYGIVILGVFSLFSCNQGKNGVGLDTECIHEMPVSPKMKEKQIFEENINYIKGFYDEIGFEIIDLILKDRVYEKKPESRPELQDLTLEEFPSKLKDTVYERKIKFFSERLIEFKQSAVAVNKADDIIDVFLNAKNKLLESSFYRDTIVGKGKDEAAYVTLEETIEEIHETTLNNIQVDSNANLSTTNFPNNTSIEKHRLDEKDHDLNESRFSNSVSKNKWWLLGVLIVSLLLNILQFFNTKKVKSNLKKDHNKKIDEMEKIHEDRYTNSRNTGQIIQDQSNTISFSFTQNIIDQEYVKLQQSLDLAYHKDCLLSIEGKFQNLKSQSIDLARSTSFSTKENVMLFVNKQVVSNKIILINELDICVTKDQATKIIHDEVTVLAFEKAINTNILSEDDIATHVNKLKELTISELPSTIMKPKLLSSIGVLKNDITKTLMQMVENNLVYYFPFADAKGALIDSKKTKNIQRDSAIKLSITLDDITKATFRLLLEKEDMMQAGIMSYDSFLIPICELTSDNFNSTGTTIEQIGPDGTMELENDVWNVKNKLPIKVI